MCIHTLFVNSIQLSYRPSYQSCGSRSIGASNDFISIGVSAHEGTAVTYRWKLDTEGLTERFKKFWYAYNRPGIYQIEVNASNSNNSYTDNGIIVVQDPINGLKVLLR